MDTIFLLTLSFIFLSAFLTLFFSRASRDRCLLRFKRALITIFMTGNHKISGWMSLYPSGIELIYESPESTEPRRKSSLIFANAFSDIVLMARFHSRLSEQGQRRRLREIRRSRRPSLFRRIVRRFRNTVASVKDGAVRAFDIALGKLKQSYPGSMLLQTQEAPLKSMGRQAIGYVGNSFDHMLESCLWQWVLVEYRVDGEPRETCGILEEYSERYLLLFDAVIFRNTIVILRPGEEEQVFEGTGIQVRGNELVLRAIGTHRRIGELMLIDNRQTLGENLLISAGKTWSYRLTGAIACQREIPVSISVDADADVILPRTSAIIRHRLELPVEER